LMYEKWESMQHLETHMHSVNMQQHAQATEGAVAHVQIRILEAQ
jgi:quinol monooxygenase YgiN